MKTILNLIITTLGVLFILSACGGGAVTVGFEEQTCTNNLFSPDCGPSGQADRTKTITDCLKDNGDCDDNIPDDAQTCLTDLFSAECEAVAETAFVRTDVTIETLRETFCEANGANDNCQTTPSVMETCTDDPFDSVCGVTYNTNRETSCRANNTSACAATITRFCETEATPENGNTLNSLCGAVKYNGAREIACRTGAHDSLCPATI
ncbi:MAG: hypothetical protein K8953_04735, partial [Proteobacteria bacterium]|nr:hypothetical protein [Pseudomonadota bacterium]